MSLLRAENVSKHFGGLAALSEVSFSIGQGEIFGLIGPNGAGKTTLFNVLTGLYTLSAGQVSLDGHAIHGQKPSQVTRLGLARTFQNIRLFANMSALENVMVGRHVRTHAGVLGAILRGAGTRKEEAAIRQRAHELLTYVGIEQALADPGEKSFLWRPAPSRNCPCAGHGAQTAGARRACRRHECERDRNA